MARSFNGTSAVITQSGGNTTAITGPFTGAAIVRRNNTSVAGIFGLDTSGGTIRLEFNIRANSGGTANELSIWTGTLATATGVTLVNADGWALIAWTKDTGTVAIRGHKYVYSSNAWTHANGTTLANTLGTGAGGTVTIGETDGDWWNGDIAVVGIWNRVLTDAEIEELPFTLMAWYTKNPNGLWVLDQSATTQDLPDLTGGGANQTATANTSITSDSLPIFNIGGPIIPLVFDTSAGAQSITPTGLTSEEAFGSDTISVGAVTISPSGIATLEAFGTALLGLYITPSSITSLEAFGSHTISVGAVIITPTGIASLEAFGTLALTTGNVNIAPSAIDSLEAFGTHLLGLYIVPSAIDTGEAFGSHTVSPGAVIVSPSAIASLEAFGSHSVSSGAAIISPIAIDTAEAFGTANITLYLVPTAISSLEAFGTDALSLFIAPTAINSAEAFETPSVTTLGSLAPAGISSLEAFGTHTISVGGVSISVSSITTAESFGDHIVSVGGSLLAPSAIVSLEAFGSSSITVGDVSINPQSIDSLEAFGSNNISLYVVPSAIGSSEAFGTHTVEIGALTISPSGIISTLSFGTVTVTGGEPIVIALATAMVRLYQHAQAQVSVRDASANVEVR